MMMDFVYGLDCCLGGVLRFDRAANAYAPLRGHSYRAPHQCPTINQHWPGVTNICLAFFNGALVRVHVAVIKAYALNCGLCLDRSSACESTRIHQVGADTLATPPSLRDFEL